MQKDFKNNRLSLCFAVVLLVGNAIGIARLYLNIS